MNNEMIEKIFCDVSQKKEYSTSKEVEHMQNVQSEQGKKVKNVVGEEAYTNTVEEIITISEAECERCGFIMGFKYAIRLMSECFNPMQNNT